MKRSTSIVLAGLTLLHSHCSWAALVSSTADGGSGSLREAIASAAPGETLTFAVTGAITLTSGELLVTTNLNINGPGAAQLTVRRSTAAGTPDFRIFNIRSGTVTISGLTVNNGRADSGGAILIQARGDLRMQDLVLSGNTATEAGGAIKNIGNLKLDRAVISGNSANGSPAAQSGFGGGLDNESSMIVSNSRIDTNLAVGGANADGLGGGIHNSATALLINCTVSDNRAVGSPSGGNGNGGGINNNGTMTLTNCTINANAASAGAGSGGGRALGGGIANDFGTVNLDKCTVSGNEVTGSNGGTGAVGTRDGGGIANNCGTVTLENSTVSGNSATPGAGTPGTGTTSGGLFNTCGTTVLNHSTVTANSAAADSSGCAVFNSLGSLELKNTIVAGNTAGFDLFSVESDIVASGGFNLIGRINVLISPGPNDQFNLTGAELKLGPLRDNGGFTFTHALLCGSPAIDAGDNTDAPETDQRGLPRIANAVIDIGAVEDHNTAPTILCPPPSTLEADASGSLKATVSVQVTDADGDELVVIWSVDGTASQTNTVAAGVTATKANVSFTATFAVGSHSVQARVIDTQQCAATCSTTLLILKEPGQACDLYPIALHEKSLLGVSVGGVIKDIYNGVQPGNFGWLTWAGSPSEPTLAKSLAAPGNSGTYINPNAPKDHTVSVGDWVQGKPGVSNSRHVRDALEALKQIDITVPVWNQARGTGNNSLYRVAAFARVRLTSYQLPRDNRISARFLGFVTCR